jgi:hypothetical protein
MTEDEKLFCPSCWSPNVERFEGGIPGRAPLLLAYCDYCSWVGEVWRLAYWPKHVQGHEPPPNLVRLSMLPRALWKGRAVLHPSSSDEHGPRWLVKDEPDAEIQTPPSWDFDVGIVIEFGFDKFMQDWRVRFLLGYGGGPSSTLTYGAMFLWTPAEPTMAEQLAAMAEGEEDGD